jgi:hypothetical protein
MYALRASPQELSRAASRLASITEAERRDLSELLEKQVVAPITRRRIYAVGEALSEKHSDLSGDQWASAVNVLLQLIGDDDLFDFLESARLLEDKQKPFLKSLVRYFRSDHPVGRVVEIDEFISARPKLQRFSCFCDVRTKFVEGHDDQPDVAIPLAVITMESDEMPGPIYFEMTESELEEHIAKLEMARRRLRYLAVPERKVP